MRANYQVKFNAFFLFIIRFRVSGVQVFKNKPWNLLESGRAKTFVNEKGQKVGCDCVLECMAFDPAFYSVSYDPKKREFGIESAIYISGTKRDSIKLGAVYLYLAKPVKDTLINMREIGVTIEDKNQDAVFPNRRGDFSVKFIVEPNDKLYFFTQAIDIANSRNIPALHGTIISLSICKSGRKKQFRFYFLFQPFLLLYLPNRNAFALFKDWRHKSDAWRL